MISKGVRAPAVQERVDGSNPLNADTDLLQQQWRRGRRQAGAGDSQNADWRTEPEWLPQDPDRPEDLTPPLGEEAMMQVVVRSPGPNVKSGRNDMLGPIVAEGAFRKCMFDKVKEAKASGVPGALQNLKTERGCEEVSVDGWLIPAVRDLAEVATSPESAEKYIVRQLDVMRDKMFGNVVDLKYKFTGGIKVRAAFKFNLKDMLFGGASGENFCSGDSFSTLQAEFRFGVQGEARYFPAQGVVLPVKGRPMSQWAYEFRLLGNPIPLEDSGYKMKIDLSAERGYDAKTALPDTLSASTEHAPPDASR